MWWSWSSPCSRAEGEGEEPKNQWMSATVSTDAAASQSEDQRPAAPTRRGQRHRHQPAGRDRRQLGQQHLGWWRRGRHWLSGRMAPLVHPGRRLHRRGRQRPARGSRRRRPRPGRSAPTFELTFHRPGIFGEAIATRSEPAEPVQHLLTAIRSGIAVASTSGLY